LHIDEEKKVKERLGVCFFVYLGVLKGASLASVVGIKAEELKFYVEEGN
jgi:hypothetical protein